MPLGSKIDRVSLTASGTCPISRLAEKDFQSFALSVYSQ